MLLLLKFLSSVGAYIVFEVKVVPREICCKNFCKSLHLQGTFNRSFERSPLPETRNARSAEYAPYQRPSRVHLFLEVMLRAPR